MTDLATLQRVAKLAEGVADEVRLMDAETRSYMVSCVARQLDVPAVVWAPSDVLACLADFEADSMTEERLGELRPHVARAWTALPGLMEKVDVDYSTVNYALDMTREGGDS
ncbi:hypothetical protein [Glutamicibacter creatinolyticus]|uniref:hypothetical protein n=1 Tax=Glutamicibacter creatinolyticus TaxID=162496 RepID=UPI003216AB75